MKVDDNLHKQGGSKGRLENEQSLNDLSDFRTCSFKLSLLV